MKMHVHPKANAEATLERLRTKMKQDNAPPKFCKDCHWHTFQRIERKDRYDYKHFCTFPPLLDRITGEPSSAAKNRSDATLCGKDAKHFAQRQRAAQEGSER